MTKVTMPEPDSYLFQHEETGLIQFVDSQQVEWGFEKINPRWHRIGGMITTDQAEAYADARVRQALEEAAQICWEMQSKPEYGKDGKDRWLAIAESRIRALIPKGSS